MGGAAKNRARKDRPHNRGKSHTEADDGQSSPSRIGDKGSPTPGSPPSALDGNQDPAAADFRTGRRQADTGAPDVYRDVYRVENKNLDLGGAALAKMFGTETNEKLPKRPEQQNTTGREVSLRLNTFHVQDVPTKTVYQYDVRVGMGEVKRGLTQKVWESHAVQSKLDKFWIYDGNRLAWSMVDRGAIALTLDVDLDKETGQESKPRPGKTPNVHKFEMKKTGSVRFDVLRNYLAKKCDADTGYLEAMNFLDHLLRETPRRSLTAIKRSFFAHGDKRFILGAGVEAVKGVYASVRPVFPGANIAPCLSINVDVSNSAFWMEGQVHFVAKDLCNARDLHQLSSMLRPNKDGSQSPAYQHLKKFKKLKVYVKHRGAEVASKTQTIDEISDINAHQYKFTTSLIDDGPQVELSVYEYFRKKYNYVLQYPELPLAKMVAKREVYNPMELLHISENQRYKFKLSDKQTSGMINFAVTVPAIRWEAIQHGLRMLNWQGDALHKHYGLKINETPATVKARILPNAKVNFGAGSAKNPVDPRTSGRWDLMGKKFLEPNKMPLKAWAVTIVPGRSTPSLDEVKKFLTTFVTVLQSHGMKIDTKQPPIIPGNADIGKAVEQAYNTAGNAANMRPQLLVFIVPDKDAHTYMRIKKSCDCRFGVVSQVMVANHIQRAQAQYCSNVAMKVNAKLGGITAAALSTGPPRGFKIPTICIGADVSHGAPGSEAASIASLTVSTDRQAVRYNAAVQTNGVRVEMITTKNINDMLEPMLNTWISHVGGGRFPEHIIYFRDGVSESQYVQVLNQEVADIREMLLTINPKSVVKFTVIVATKRHHVRFFPQNNTGDKNGNPQPGTLVDSGVTHPFEYDFYLCSHAAIKGTARPVHYYVLKDEANIPPAQLQGMIYEHSYQYVRSTTPVSLFPAVYYAHLAANRATAHMNEPAGAGPKEKVKGKDDTSRNVPAEIKPLLPMPLNTNIRNTMWFV